MRNRGILLPAMLAVLFCLAMGMVPERCWPATAEVRLSRGQTVYVPVYSHVFSGPRNIPFLLAATLSIRNTDLSASLRVTPDKI